MFFTTIKNRCNQVNEGKCNGCGICANACHEGAIDIVNGKAKLVRENFCDGFDDCLPGCPMGVLKRLIYSSQGYTMYIHEGGIAYAGSSKSMGK